LPLSELSLLVVDQPSASRAFFFGFAFFPFFAAWSSTATAFSELQALPMLFNRYRRAAFTTYAAERMRARQLAKSTGASNASIAAGAAMRCYSASISPLGAVSAVVTTASRSLVVSSLHF